MLYYLSRHPPHLARLMAAWVAYFTVADLLTRPSLPNFATMWTLRRWKECQCEICDGSYLLYALLSTAGDFVFRINYYDLVPLAISLDHLACHDSHLGRKPNGFSRFCLLMIRLSSLESMHFPGELRWKAACWPACSYRKPSDIAPPQFSGVSWICSSHKAWGHFESTLIQLSQVELADKIARYSLVGESITGG